MPSLSFRERLLLALANNDVDLATAALAADVVAADARLHLCITRNEQRRVAVDHDGLRAVYQSCIASCADALERFHGNGEPFPPRRALRITRDTFQRKTTELGGV